MFIFTLKSGLFEKLFVKCENECLINTFARVSEMRMQYGAFDAYYLLNKLGKMVLSRNVQLDNIIMLQKIVFLFENDMKFQIVMVIVIVFAAVLMKLLIFFQVATVCYIVSKARCTQVQKHGRFVFVCLIAFFHLRTNIDSESVYHCFQLISFLKYRQSIIQLVNQSIYYWRQV